MSALYSLFRTNKDKEQSGVDIPMGENEDGTVISFRLARAGKTNKQYQTALEAATKPYRRQIELETMQAEKAESIYREVFVNTILLGWSNVRDEQGQNIPFTRQNALKLFTDLPDLYDTLQAASTKVSNFREEKLEDEAKN